MTMAMLLIRHAYNTSMTLDEITKKMESERSASNTAMEKVCHVRCTRLGAAMQRKMCVMGQVVMLYM